MRASEVGIRGIRQASHAPCTSCTQLARPSWMRHARGALVGGLVGFLAFRGFSGALGGLVVGWLLAAWLRRRRIGAAPPPAPRIGGQPLPRVLGRREGVPGSTVLDGLPRFRQPGT